MRVRLETLAIAAASLAIGTAAGGCTRLSPVKWSEYASVDPSGWDPMMAVEFTPQPPDSVWPWPGVCDVVVSVRYKADTPHSRLRLKVTEESLESDTIATRQLDFPLFNTSRRPSGRGSYAVFEMSDTIRRSFTVPQGYSVTLSLPAGSEPPEGIVDVGVLLTGSGEKTAVWMPHLGL